MTDHNNQPAPVTKREALRLLWQANKYPIHGNEDWPVSDRMEKEALEQAKTAISSPDDLPEFTRWLEALQNPQTNNDEREEVYDAIYDYFASETKV